jgi:hypothetical protein
LGIANALSQHDVSTTHIAMSTELADRRREASMRLIRLLDQAEIASLCELLSIPPDSEVDTAVQKLAELPRYELWFEGAVAVSGYLNGQLAKFALEGLLALAVAGVAGTILDRFVLAVAEVIGHFGFEGFLDQQFGKLFQQPVLTDQVFRLPVISQQAIQQLLGYGFLCYGHLRSLREGGSFLPIDRLHKNSYTLHCQS